MSDLDYSDFINIKITRVFDETGPAFWEMDFTDKTGHSVASSTGPTVWSGIDFAVELLQRDDWADFDANSKEEECFCDPCDNPDCDCRRKRCDVCIAKDAE